MKIKLNHLKNITSILLFSIFILGSPSILAQNKNEEVKLNIQLRPRAEFRNGLFTPILKGQKPAAFVAQRSRIGLIYSKNQKLKIGLSTQVVTTWGNDPQVQTTANDISLYEAWAQFYFNPYWSVKVGRQILSYDDQRILGALDWNNAGRKHDAILLGFDKNKFEANAAFAFNQNAEKVTNTYFNNSLSQPYKAMQFLWMKYKFTNALSISALALDLNMQNRIDSSVSNLQTLGGNIYYKKDKLNITGTYYYQTGRNPVNNSSYIKTNAWMTAVKAVYDFNQKIGLGIGSDYLSGKDMNSTSSKITYFNPLYGTHHKFYGFMDYFYVSSTHDNVGLWDSYLNVNLNASQKLDWQIALHHFESAARVINYTGGKASSALGNEADITFGFKVMDNVKIAGGYSQMFTDPSMKYVKNISANQSMKSLQNWIWISININPDILIYKSK
ncbi:MAG: alginate export family protein [Bacteroidota bacterium]|nr:alginate export family protein [Bacteroidota bacterium]